MQQRGRASDLWLILLLVPFVALLWVPFYGHATPKLGPIPFFIWYQFLWVILGAAIVYLVYLLRRTPEDLAATSAPAPGTPPEPMPASTEAPR